MQTNASTENTDTHTYETHTGHTVMYDHGLNAKNSQRRQML